jgi:hypothetical protein
MHQVIGKCAESMLQLVQTLYAAYVNTACAQFFSDCKAMREYFKPTKIKVKLLCNDQDGRQKNRSRGEALQCLRSLVSLVYSSLLQLIKFRSVKG